MQTKLAALGLIAVAGGGTWLATAPSSDDYYAMSPQEASSRLVSASMPGQVHDEMSANADIEQRVYRRGADEVVWEFSVARTPLATFTAALEPDGQGTRVSVEFAMADNELGDAARSDLGEAQEFLTGVLELAMQEHVAATLERRRFDEDGFGTDLAKYALTNPDAARKFMRKAQSGGGTATEARLRKKVEDDAAWHGDVEQTDTSGSDPEAFDPTPPKDGW